VLGSRAGPAAAAWAAADDRSVDVPAQDGTWRSIPPPPSF